MKPALLIKQKRYSVAGGDEMCRGVAIHWISRAQKCSTPCSMEASYVPMEDINYGGSFSAAYVTFVLGVVFNDQTKFSYSCYFGKTTLATL